MKSCMRFAGIGLLILLPLASISQKKMISLPFEFEKGILTRSDYDAYFLGNERDSSFSLVLKDNKKAQYVLIDKNFKIISKVDMDLNSTVFNEDITEYRGGTTSGNIFQLNYEEREKKAFARPVTVFQMETIDFAAKTVKHQKLFEIPKSEKLLSSFSDNNMFYTITADDKTKEVIIHSMNDQGLYKSTRIPFTIPAAASKKRDKLSEYFANLQVIKNGEEPDLSAAVSPAKLFSRRGKIEFVINEEGKAAHIFTIQLPSFSVQEKFIDFTAFKAAGKEKMMVTSFLKNDRLFSLLLDKKTIRIAVHDVGTGKLEHQYEINEETPSGIFAKYPVTERRMGKRSVEKDIDDTKKLIKALYNGSEGIMTNENSKGQLIVTIGTYNLIPLSSGSSGGGFEPSNIATTPGVINYGGARSTMNSYSMTYRPGTPSFTTTSARYYNSTYFKLLLDATGSKIEKGKTGVPVADQIKDYLEQVDPKAKATNQFAIGERQFYGYYDNDDKAYVIEEIKMRK